LSEASESGIVIQAYMWFCDNCFTCDRITWIVLVLILPYLIELD